MRKYVEAIFFKTEEANKKLLIFNYYLMKRSTVPPLVASVHIQLTIVYQISPK